MLWQNAVSPGSQLPSPGFRFAGTDGCLAWSGSPPTTMGRCDISRDGLCLRRQRGRCPVSGEYPQDPKRAETPLNAPGTRLEWVKGAPRGFPFNRRDGLGNRRYCVRNGLVRTTWRFCDTAGFLSAWCPIGTLLAGLGSELARLGRTRSPVSITRLGGILTSSSACLRGLLILKYSIDASCYQVPLATPEPPSHGGDNHIRDSFTEDKRQRGKLPLSPPDPPARVQDVLRSNCPIIHIRVERRAVSPHQMAERAQNAKGTTRHTVQA